MLDEAIAQYAIERDGILNELHPYAGDYPDTSISWHRERDRLALDAAVRDVAFQMIQECTLRMSEGAWNTGLLLPVVDKLNRLLPEGSEGVK